MGNTLDDHSFVLGILTRKYPDFQPGKTLVKRGLREQDDDERVSFIPLQRNKRFAYGELNEVCLVMDVQFAH